MLTFFGMTDVGLKRSNNQDGFYTGYIDDSTFVCAVCDGMGGASAGDEASRLALESVTAYLKENVKTKDVDFAELIKNAVYEANTKVFEKANSSNDFQGMGTTLVCAVFNDGKVYFASVGDSRIYVSKQNKLLQLSHDHSYVQTLIDSGQITAEQALVHPNRNIITKAIGTENEVEPDVFVLDEAQLDAVLLCSDGLCGYVSYDDIQDAFCASQTPKEFVARSIKLALDTGGADNITAACVFLNGKAKNISEGMA